MEEMFKYILEGILTLGVGAMVWVLKDFKESITNLTNKLTEVTISLKELIIKDESKDEKIGEMKAKQEQHERDIQLLKLKVAMLENNKHK